MSHQGEYDSTDILALFDATESLEKTFARLDDGAAIDARLDIEALGLLAHALEPVTPQRASRQRLLAALGEPELAPVVSLAAARADREAPPGTREPWRWSVAAALLAGLLGVGAAGWLFYQQAEIANELARVRTERESLISELRQREQQLSAEREARQGDVGRRDQALSLVASRGVEVCPLRPVGAGLRQPDAFAVLYMAATQKSWYVKASQLAPPPPGQTYRVWFETDAGSVFAGDLRPSPDLDLQFDSASFRSLAMKGVKVTLEPAGSGAVPTGPTVLFGADKMTVL